jgi:trimeric autotransporter adhesin
VTGFIDVGGLAGLNYSGRISASYASGGVIGANNSIGGLVGSSTGTSTISGSHATGSVSATGSDVGGLTGLNEGAVSSSYSTGRVSGSSYVGGLVGDSVFTVTHSFWDVTTSGQTTSAGGTGLTTAQMHTESTFTTAGWNFTPFGTCRAAAPRCCARSRSRHDAVDRDCPMMQPGRTAYIEMRRRVSRHAIQQVVETR